MASAFTYSTSHQNAEGHEILDGFIDSVTNNVALAEVQTQVAALPPTKKVAVLRACVERMPYYRSIRDEKSGAICYELACKLYGQKLAYTEADVCDLLNCSKHGCGHGGDVTPIWDVLVSYIKKHGATPAVMESTRNFAEKLVGVVSIQANNFKVKAALILTLDSRNQSRTKCCSTRFSDSLAAMPAPERLKWEQFVLDMTITMQCAMPQSTQKKAAKFIAAVGAHTVLEQLKTWWPAASEQKTWPIQTAGSHVLKNFVWVLQVIAQQDEFRGKCDKLIYQLADIDWKPGDKGQKIMITAAYYLSERQSEENWRALQAIETWCRGLPKSDYTGSKLEGLINEYRLKR